ncbi:MAG TPA: hypothetical protein PLZ08_12260 [Bacillota bacterium]|nr:hypothetical protein [Bacillota bacterium]HOL10957.1 hypothetical protein [Bacillota bacterium]HPO98712.1 hypothetical protein [Bacillota bacterium]
MAINKLATVIAIILLLSGGWITILNFTCFYNGFIKKQKTASWIPLLGAFLCCGGLILIGGKYSTFWWLPFILDFGSLPGFTFTLFFYIKDKYSPK